MSKFTIMKYQNIWYNKYQKKINILHKYLLDKIN